MEISFSRAEIRRLKMPQSRKAPPFPRKKKASHAADSFVRGPLYISGAPEADLTRLLENGAREYNISICINEKTIPLFKTEFNAKF